MKQKMLSILCIAVSLISFVPQSFAQKGKSELKLGYGQITEFQLNNRPPYSTSSGAFCLSYNYYVSRSVTIGLGLGYERISNWASFTSIVPEVTVKYLDTRNTQVRVRLYGTVGYGISALTDLHVGPGQVDESGAKPWGFQVTPIGVRIGRQWAGFCELGMGYKGIVHGGLAVRFPRYLQHKNKTTE